VRGRGGASAIETRRERISTLFINDISFAGISENFVEANEKKTDTRAGLFRQAPFFIRCFINRWLVRLWLRAVNVVVVPPDHHDVSVTKNVVFVLYVIGNTLTDPNKK